VAEFASRLLFDDLMTLTDASTEFKEAQASHAAGIRSFLSFVQELAS
jgi:hypothetical protein